MNVEQLNPRKTALELASIEDPPVNPNHMSAQRYAQLVNSIRKNGWLQEPLVARLIYPDPDPDVGDTFQVVDGYHRLRAARELEWSHVGVILIDATPEQARALQISLNRLRGELNLSEVGESIEVLLKAGWKPEELDVTGFTQDEVERLVELNQADEDMTADAARELGGQADEDAAAKKPKPYVLELTFATADELKFIKRKLRKAAKPSKDLAVGLKKLVDGA
jgi:ParB-like chromosome segregation protein Spo0J